MFGGCACRADADGSIECVEELHEHQSVFGLVWEIEREQIPRLVSSVAAAAVCVVLMVDAGVFVSLLVVAWCCVVVAQLESVPHGWVVVVVVVVVSMVVCLLFLLLLLLLLLFLPSSLPSSPSSTAGLPFSASPAVPASGSSSLA